MEKIISKDGVPISCRRSGSGPPLVLVHGTGSSSARWAPVLPLLDAHFTTYAVDRRGRGKSGDAPDYRIEREFEDIASAVDAIGEPCNLLGHSYGGICSLEATRLTQSVRRLVLYEPPIPVEDTAIYVPGIIERLESLAAAGEHERLLSDFLLEVVRMPPRDLENLQKSETWTSRLASAHTIPRELRAHERYRFSSERFTSFNIPTLLLVGGDSPGFFKISVELLKASLRNSRVTVLSGQRHNAMETAPEQFAAEVTAFLKG